MEQHKDSETILSSIVMEKALPKVLATPVQIHGRNLISRGVESKGQAKCAHSDNPVIRTWRVYGWKPSILRETLNKFSVFSSIADKVMGAGGEIRKT